MFETKGQNILGNDGFIWFKGVVEDNNDPWQLGRLRVRVFGDHTPDKEEIPTEDLPWSVLMMPATSASMNGIGLAPVGIEKGSWVYGFFLDGLNKQVPAILGTWNGIPEKEPDPKLGFHDPDLKFPMKSFLEEPDTNRLARGELDEVRSQYQDCEGVPLPPSENPKKGTEKKPDAPIHLTDIKTEHKVLKHKRSTLQCENKTFMGVWHQPITQYNAKYPYNAVTEYHFDDEKWGHLLEFDSTPGYERIHLFHSSGTFMEIMNDKQNDDCGRKVEKIVGDNFEIDMKNKHLFVKGDYKVTIDGNRDEYIKGNYYMHVQGSLNWKIDGQYIAEESEFLPFPECKGGVAEKIPQVPSYGSAIKWDITGSTNGIGMDLDMIGHWYEDIIGMKKRNISIQSDTTTTNINNSASGNVSNKALNIDSQASMKISNKANIIENKACEMLTLEASTILETTCLLLQNIEDMQMTIEPCKPC